MATLTTCEFCGLGASHSLWLQADLDLLPIYGTKVLYQISENTGALSSGSVSGLRRPVIQRRRAALSVD